MKKALFLLVLLNMAACAHTRFGISCSDYCASSGGFCNYIKEGRRDYNTTDGSYHEIPTIFVCKYDR